MIRPLVVFFAVGLLVANGCGSVLFAGEHGIQIQAVSPWNDPNGYTPVVVTIDATREIDLDLRIDGDGSSARAVVRVAEGRAARQTILLPPSNSSLNLNTIEWSGPEGINGRTQISNFGHQQIRCALIDPKQLVVEADLEKSLAGIVGSGGSSRKDLLLRVQPEDLPDRWQGYPDWLVLVLTPPGDAGLDEAQRQAISAWTRSGGTLVVTTAELQRAWSTRQAEVLLDPLSGKPEVLGKALVGQIAYESWRPVDAPVPGTETVPVKTFVVLALAFAIVVGPLNLWWVRRRNARHLFLITTPLISFVTCVVLIVASLLADGISVKRDAAQVCYIDHRTQQMIRWTGCTYFAAFARSQLDLDPQTKMRVLDRDDYSSSRHSRRNDSEHLHVDWSRGQLLSGSVLPARLNRQLSYTELLPERRRLVVSRQGDAYQVTNGLGTAMLGFAWCDAQGTYWSCDAVAAGEVATLTAVPKGDQVTVALPATAEEQPTWNSESLPAAIANRIGRDVAQSFERLHGQPLTFVAVLKAPMDVLPGPSATDPQPPKVFAFGYLPLGGTAVEGKP